MKHPSDITGPEFEPSSRWRTTERHHAPTHSTVLPTQIWNVHQVILDGEHRTNYLCDVWNHRIEYLCDVSHPSVRKLIHWIKADAAQVSTTLLNAVGGEPPHKRVKRVNNQLQSRLHRCTDDMGARLLKCSFNELVTTSAGNFMVE
ncbi:hypothetical protein LSH36_756g02045 [Paralvinella palmiformis]|uniref:Uncharacterized protein n=1 Tax=Paralvinella palmiformis TaxID=53620 RepID=A0AAD9J196_9ANNE|nr:hypothetical protein LSH36_756g02045 [Paralvinella palmiformis]